MTIDGEHAQRLDELAKDEFRSIALALCPEWTEEEFERKWAEFAALKALRGSCAGSA